jgi:WS/DGAT/MGAT family acyltransferase
MSGTAVKPHFERLSALDASFLALETPKAPMHVGAVLVFDGDAHTEEGQLDFDRVTKYVGSAVQSCPRYRQRIRRVPALGHPVWVDDQRFDLRFHVRRASVPAPGDDAALKALAGRLLSQHLDRSRPLWEMYVVDGLRSNGFALICKVHHCMVDGVGGMQLLQALLRPFPDSSLPAPDAWTPRPEPKSWDLLKAELAHRVDSVKALKTARPSGAFSSRLSGLWSTTQEGLRAALHTSPLTSPDVTRYRRFEWTAMDLAEIKRIRKHFDGTVNDVLVAVTTGAIRRSLERDGVDVSELESLRAVLPVHVGAPKRRAAGNHVAMLLADLPLDASGTRERMTRVIEVTRQLKESSNQSDGVQLVEELADATSGALLAELVKLAMRLEMFDLILTNIAGPQVPLYLLQAPMRAIYPVVPLMPNQSVGIALFSYDGSICWGINADWEAFPQLQAFVDDLQHAYEALRREVDADTVQPHASASGHQASA